MIQYNPNLFLFSLHIPKSGGTSLTEVLKKWFWPGFHAHYFRHEENKMPFEPRKVKLFAHSIGIFPLCIHGHFEEEADVFTCYPKAKQFITFLRDPLEMHISLFFDHQRRLRDEGALYWKGEKVSIDYEDLDEWIEKRPFFLLHFMPWSVSSENYLDVINKNFIHVGITENLQKSVDIMAQKLGKKTVNIPHLNTSKRSQKPSTTSINVFKKKYALEYSIYEYACSINS